MYYIIFNLLKLFNNRSIIRVEHEESSERTHEKFSVTLYSNTSFRCEYSLHKFSEEQKILFEETEQTEISQIHDRLSFWSKKKFFTCFY